MYGRRRHFKKYFNKYTGQEEYEAKAFRQSFNFLVQSSSADMMRKSMIDTRELIKRNPHWGLKQIATVHDEQVLIVREEYMKEAGEAVKGVMERSLSLCVPVVCDVGYGNNYSEAK